jgi:hypothetical protein
MWKGSKILSMERFGTAFKCWCQNGSWALSQQMEQIVLWRYRSYSVANEKIHCLELQTKRGYMLIDHETAITWVPQSRIPLPNALLICELCCKSPKKRGHITQPIQIQLQWGGTRRQPRDVQRCHAEAI